MSINKTCQNVLFNLYAYDFVSAFPRLLRSVGVQLKSDLTNKKERSIEIGKLQKQNPNVSIFLSESVRNLLNLYLIKNSIDYDEVIVTQTDGFITTRQLDDTTSFEKLDLRDFIDFLIISIDRQKYLAFTSNKTIVKGVSNYYPALLPFYDLFRKLDFYNRDHLFTNMNFIKESFFNCTVKEIFMIPVDGEFYIQDRSGSTIKVIDETVFDIDDIDKRRYFNHYFKGFLDSVFLQFYRS